MPAGPASGWMRGGAWALASLGLALGMAAVRMVLVARLIGAAQMGTAGVALLVLTTLEALTSLGTEVALVTRRGRVEDDLDPAFTLELLRGAALSAVALAVAPLAAQLLSTPGATPLIRVLALLPLLRGLANPAAALLVRGAEFRRLFWWGVPEAVVGLVVAVAVAVLRRDAWALVASALAMQTVGTGLSYAMVRYRPRLRLGGRGARRLLHYGGALNRTRILTFLSLNLDNMLVGRFLGPTALGLYQVAFRVAEIPAVTITRAAARVALPMFGPLRGSPRALAGRYLTTVAAVCTAGCVFAALALLLGEPGVRWMLGPEWTRMVPALQLLALAMVFRGIMQISDQLFNALSRPGLSLPAQGVRLAVLSVALYPLLRWDGLRGVATAVLLAHAGGALVAAGGAFVLLRGPARLRLPGGGAAAE
ncbi:MAG TPA: oligosaccharide flippase family protein [Longimicrobium sp.]